MSEIYRKKGFPIAIKKEEIARVLGYGRKRIPKRVQSILEGIEKSHGDLISSACAYRYFKKEELARSVYLSGVHLAAVCLVTIGGKLEAAVDEEKKRGDLSKALILDSYGSAAAEACADAAEAIICRQVTEMGLRCSRRFSPGYGGWDVVEQKWILPALDGEALGVRLTEGCMMVPRKSITFAVTIGKAPVEFRNVSACEVCGLLNCRYRHED